MGSLDHAAIDRVADSTGWVVAAIDSAVDSIDLEADSSWDCLGYSGPASST